MFDNLDVQSVPGEGVLHRNHDCIVLVVSKPSTTQSEALSAWAKGPSSEPLPDVEGVVALRHWEEQFFFHANGPVVATLNSSSGSLEFELDKTESVAGLRLRSIDLVEGWHPERISEMPDPFTSLATGTVSASGFIARRQAPLPVEDSHPDVFALAAEQVETGQQPPVPPLPPNVDDVPPHPNAGSATPPTPPIDAARTERSDVYVLGVVCPACQNFNHPDAPYCFVDGHRLVETRVLQRDRRPTLGHLRLSHNGSHVQLLKSVVLGRAPDVSPLVSSDEAEPVHLDDPSMSLSRSHAVVELRDWGIFLRDDGSQNGTWVIEANGARRRLGPDEEIQLEKETTFALGPTVLTFVPAPLQ